MFSESNSRVPLTDINTCSRFNGEQNVVTSSHSIPSCLKTFPNPGLPSCSKSLESTYAQDIPVHIAPIQNHLQFRNPSSFYLFTHDSSQGLYQCFLVCADKLISWRTNDQHNILSIWCDFVQFYCLCWVFNIIVTLHFIYCSRWDKSSLKILELQNCIFYKIL